MPESELLSAAEVRSLTERARHDDQCRVLTELGLPFRVVGRGIKVSRYHLREWLSGRAVTPTRGPNMGAIR
ncbi:MAG: DUF4224 domain-containing protein [Methylibium sp.]|nr:DUF4224 domain-containing protein [Methylibium sp.]